MEGGAGVVPPNSIPSGEYTAWADASPLIASACSDLRHGELIHGENFNLFAAMSALEIMDPKMDSGMEGNGFRSIEEAIENGAAPVPLSSDRTLDTHRCIDVMDHLLACEATWHKGYSLAQTVYSCIYLLKIDRTCSHALLHSYCRMLRATCNALLTAVSDAHTHEEEDLFTMAYGLPLKAEGDEKCLSILNSAEETVSRQLRAHKSRASRKKPLDDESLQTNLDLEEGYCQALLCRLRFRKHFYHALICMRKSGGRGLELAKKHVTTCLSELASMSKSAEFLRSKARESCHCEPEGRTTASGQQPFGFDASLNSRLSAPTPPRAIQIVSWKQAVEYFEKLLDDLDAICSLPLDPLLEKILHLVVQFQKRQPDLVARAHLQLLFVHDGKLYGKDSLQEVILRALAMPEVAKDLAFQGNEFVLQLGQLTVNLIKILCTNLAWQRRKLGKALQDWSVISIQVVLVLKLDILQVFHIVSEQLELAFRREFGEILKVSPEENLCMKLSKRLLIWAEEHTYWIASRFLLLGFQLELYSPKEYCMVYWYMYAIFVNLLEKMQMRTTYFGDTSRRKGKKKRNPAREVSFDFGVGISSMCLLLQCYIYISKGLAMMLAALRNESKCFRISSPFNNELERFNQHFELLQKANVPRHISYNLFKESTSGVCVSNVLKHDYFREVHRIILLLRGSFSTDPDQLLELRQLEQVVEHNLIALGLINQVGANNPSLRVSFEFRHHPFFAVAVVRRA